MSGGRITARDAQRIVSVPTADIFSLFLSASRIRARFRGDSVDICAIVNAKSGACPEDCAYCAQSSKSRSGAPVYPLLDRQAILEKAAEARAGGAKRFCIVTSGRKTSAGEIDKIAAVIPEVRGLGLLPCATLGLLEKEELLSLKDAGLERFHHNLETSERFFPKICSTHTFREKLKTIEAVRSCGLSLCSGGIFGLGETWRDRIDLASELRDIGPDSVPVNFLIPVSGTRLGSLAALEPFEALRIISLMRFMMPEKEIRVCGGRVQTLGEFHSFIFAAGADGLLSGNYLTTTGRSFRNDLELVRRHGLRA
ncbi:MAG: biotin synthase BioB [Nitrospiraceae bacterium]|nr:biotin synthase BioB [Nitrospiraceae bacterium]